MARFYSFDGHFAQCLGVLSRLISWQSLPVIIYPPHLPVETVCDNPNSFIACLTASPSATRAASTSAQLGPRSST